MTNHEWYKQAQYGMMIHWGLYSLLAGEWKGKRTPEIGEWIQAYFAIKNENAKQNFSICHINDIALPSYNIAAEFTQTAKNLFNIKNPLHILCAED